MTGKLWPLVEVVALLLAPVEREALLGDLLETGEAGWQGVLAVLGLVVRRQRLQWSFHFSPRSLKPAFYFTYRARSGTPSDWWPSRDLPCPESP